MNIKRKRYYIGGLLILFMILAVVTNPTTQDYIDFIEEQSGTPIPLNIDIERNNFFIFSTYAPKIISTGEYGTVHLGFMGKFFKISQGQYDYPWWLASYCFTHSKKSFWKSPSE